MAVIDPFFRLAHIQNEGAGIPFAGGFLYADGVGQRAGDGGLLAAVEYQNNGYSGDNQHRR
jgi:hypothetical protein